MSLLYLVTTRPVAAEIAQAVVWRLLGLVAAAIAIVAWCRAGLGFPDLTVDAMLALAAAGTVSWAYSIPALCRDLAAMRQGRVCPDCGNPNLFPHHCPMP